MPPVPFDWEVRAAFATVRIPSLKEHHSAFALASLRLAKGLFPKFGESLKEFESATVGTWFASISRTIEDLREQRRYLSRKEPPHGTGVSAFAHEIIERWRRIPWRHRWPDWSASVLTTIKWMAAEPSRTVTHKRSPLRVAIWFVDGFCFSCLVRHRKARSPRRVPAWFRERENCPG